MRTRCALVSMLLLIAIGRPIHAATFDLVYYDNDVFPDPLVGTGTFSYDGPATVGSFALDTLTGVAFEATIVGISFDWADLITDLSASGISVFSISAGQFGLVFTGSGGAFNGGSLELEKFDPENGERFDLSHEPTAAISDPLGCCGGNGTQNRYGLVDETFSLVAAGDYRATAIPEPGTLALSALGLAALAVARRPAR